MKKISSSMVSTVACACLMSVVWVQPLQAEEAKEQLPQGSQKNQLQDVQNRQQSLKTQMDLIRKTNNLQERQRLLDEHLKAMLTQVQAMSKMSGAPLDPGTREALLEERTRLITALMDQMISHYEMEATCSAK